MKHSEKPTYMKTICILFAACTIISLPAYSWDYAGNYENIPSEDEDYSIQTPAVIETVKVGGFTLDMDRMETGFYIPRQAQGNFLGEFRGDGFDIRVFRIPHSGQPLEKVATESKRNTGDIVRWPILAVIEDTRHSSRIFWKANSRFHQHTRHPILLCQPKRGDDLLRRTVDKASYGLVHRGPSYIRNDNSCAFVISVEKEKRW